MQKAFIFTLGLAIFLFGCSKNPEQEDVLRIAMVDAPESLDPHRRNAYGSLNLAGQMYESLVAYDRNLGVKPALAESWENPTENVWRFHLRRNVRFHTGQNMDANDVAATLERLRSDPKLENAGYISHISSIKVKAPYTIEITTNRLSISTLHRLLYVFIVPRNYREFDSKWESMSIGTGPFRLASAGDSHLKLIAHPEYWGQKPAYENVEFSFFTDYQKILDVLPNDGFQIARFDGPDLPDSLKPEYSLASTETLYVVYLGFNMDKKSGLFSNRAARNSLAKALDRQKIIQEARFGRATATVQLVSPFVYGFNPTIKFSAISPDRPKFAPHPELKFLARQILNRTATSMMSQFQNLKLNAKLITLPDADFFRQVRSGDFDFFLSRWGCRTGDASELFDSCFYTRGKKDGFGLNNYTRYSSAEIDMEIERSSLISDPRERIRKLQSLVTQIDTDQPWIPLYISHDVYAVSKQVEWLPRLDSCVLAKEVQPVKR